MNDFVDSFAYWLADYYLSTTVLLAAALLAIRECRQPVKRLAVAKATVVAMAVLAGLCALPGWSVISLVTAEAPQEIEPTVLAPVATTSISQSPIPLAIAQPELAVVRPVVKAVAEVPLLPQQISWPTIALAVYFFGSMVIICWLMLGSIAARRLVRRAHPAPASFREVLLRSGSDRSRRAQLLVSDDIDVAVAIGVWRPRVILPSGWASRRSPEELSTVLAHEVAHVENGDLAWLAFSRLMLVVAWAQPLYLMLRRTVRLDQEALADAAAAEHTGRRQYAEQLVAWARDLSAQPRLSLPAAMGLWEGPSQLRRRVALLMDERLTMLRRCPRVWQLSAIALVVALAALLSVATLEPMNIAKAEQSDAATAAETQHTTQHTVSRAGTTFTFAAGNPATPWDYRPNVLAIVVQDEGGKPIEGVEAMVIRTSPKSGERVVVPRATTNAEGKVEFDGLVDSKRAATLQELEEQSQFPLTQGDVFYVVLRQEGRATVILAASDFTLAGRGVKRGVRMRPAVELSGRVTDREGKPVVGAMVAAGGFAGSFRLKGFNAVMTNADGRYRFTDRVVFTREAANKRIAEQNQWATAADRDMSKQYPAVYDPAEDTSVSDLYVTHPDYAVTTVRGGDVPGETDVVMQPAAAIQGRVVEFATGKPAAGVQVKASGAPTVPEAEDRSDVRADDGARLYLATLHTASTRTDAEGRYLLANLPVGKYDVWAQLASDDSGKSEWVCRGVTGVKAEAGDWPTETPDLIIGPGGTIRGQLLNAVSNEPISFEVDGASLKAVSYLLNGPNQQSTLMQTVPVTRDGEFEAHALPGKSRMFVIVSLPRGEGNSQGDYRSDDETFQTGPEFDLAHGTAVDAEFRVWPRAQLDEKRSKVMRGFSLLNEQKYDNAIAVFTELIAGDPMDLSALSGRGAALERLGRIAEAISDYEAVLKITPDDIGTMSRTADLLATSADANVRNGRRAAELATQALDATRQIAPKSESEAMALALLAAAQAEAGEFEAAVATQREAIAVASESVRDSLRERLKLYEARKPYRREGTKAGN